MNTTRKAKTPKAIASTQSLSAFVKSVCDVMRRSNCASALQYVPELTWILFLRLLDAQEAREQAEAEALGADFSPALESPFRWQDWAAPHGAKRQQLYEAGEGALFAFINELLLPYLRDLHKGMHATPKQRIISRIMLAADKTVRMDSETNLYDTLDRVHEISIDHIDDQHFFTLSQVYEDLLLKMGEKNSDGGQFFTPREVIRAMVHTVNPHLGQTVYDPCCGTGGFLAVAYEHMARALGNAPAATDIERLKHETFFGREKENLVFPIALANLVLHGIDQPNIWHGNSLNGRAFHDELFSHAPAQFDVVLTNPPFGGKEGRDAQQNFAFATSATQVLFVQKILDELKDGGTCAIVLDEGLLFRTNESAFVDTKRKLTDECDLWAIVSLPGGVFSTAGAGVKTNLLFFTKGRPTQRIWYYDLSWVKVGKKTPLTLAHFGFGKAGEVLDAAALPAALTATLSADWQGDGAHAAQPFPSYARLLPHRGTPEGESRYSWTLDFAARRTAAHEQALPLRDKAAGAKVAAANLKERIRRLKKDGANTQQLETLEAELRAQEKAARDLEAEAAAIEAAVYDLKAVNPNALEAADERSPDEIIQSITAQGRIAADALARLAELLENDALQTDTKPSFQLTP